MNSKIVLWTPYRIGLKIYVYILYNILIVSIIILILQSVNQKNKEMYELNQNHSFEKMHS